MGIVEQRPFPEIRTVQPQHIESVEIQITDIGRLAKQKFDLTGD